MKFSKQKVLLPQKNHSNVQKYLGIFLGGVLFLMTSSSGYCNEELRPVTHFRPAQGWVGDVHPIYYDNAWHLPYLEVPREPMRHGLSRVHSSEIVSTDLIHWTTREIEYSDLSAPWWMVANIIRENTIYSFFNGPLGINLATSQDHTHWTPYGSNPVIPYSLIPAGYELRDPYVFHNPDDNLFWMVLAGKKPNLDYDQSGFYYYSTSSDLYQWTAPAVLYDPGNIGVPECPDMFKLYDKFYLIGSWGSGRVGQGRYRMASSATGPWTVPTIDTLDGTELMAPNSAQGPTERLLFGWIPTYVNREDYASYEWGGHLAYPRVIYADGSGKLFLRPPAALTQLRDQTTTFNAGSAYELLGGTWTPGLQQLAGASSEGYAQALLPGSFARFECVTTIGVDSHCNRAGVLFRMGDTGFPGYEVCVDYINQNFLLRRYQDSTNVLASQPISVTRDAALELRVFVDGDVVEAFLDNKYALAGRAQVAGVNNRIGFYGYKGTAYFGYPSVHTLKAIYLPPDPPVVNTYPSPDLKRATGQSVLLPTSTANVYCPFNTALNFSGDFSLEFWIKETPGTGGYKSHLLCKGDGSDPGYHYGLELNADRSFSFFYKNTAGQYDGLQSAANCIEDGEWIHLGVSFDVTNGQLRLYKNGVLVSSRQGGILPLDASNQGALRLGLAAGLPGGLPFYGMIDEVRIWKSARTNEQMSQGYLQRLDASSLTDLVVYWTFDEWLQETASPNRFYHANKVTTYPTMNAILFDGAEKMTENSLPMANDSSPNAVSFSTAGENAYVPFDQALNFEGSFTLETWAYVTEGQGGVKANLIVKGDSSDPGYHYGLNIMPDRSLQLYFKNSAGNFEGHETPAGLVADATWTHLAGAVDLATSEIRLYVNGQRQATKTISGLPLISTNLGALRFGLGAGLPSSNQFYGALDEVRIWRTALNDFQILAQYNTRLLARDHNDLIGYWDFDDLRLSSYAPYRTYTPNLAPQFSPLICTLFDGAGVQTQNAPVSTALLPAPVDSAAAYWYFGDGLPTGLDAYGTISYEHGAEGLGARPPRDCAQLTSAYFNAGSQLGASGTGLTVYLRVRDPQGAWGTALFAKRGSHETVNYNLFSVDLAGSEGQDIGFEVRTSAGFEMVSFPVSQIDAQAWHSLVGRYDGQQVQIICDGLIMASKSLQGNLISNNEPALIGAETDDGVIVRPFTGQIEEAAVWTRALSDTEAANLMQCSSLAFYSAQYLHYKHPDHAVGDMHPYFYNGKYYVNYLYDPGTWQVGQLRSRDLLHWDWVQPAHQPVSDGKVLPNYFALQIFDDIDLGDYRTFYAYDGVRSSVSSNLLDWDFAQPHQLLPDMSSMYERFSDPYVVRDEQNDRYVMLVTLRKKDVEASVAGAVGYATATSMNGWTYRGDLYYPGNVGDPEVPSAFKINNKWYLLTSFSDGGVGKASYRIADQLEGPWTKPYPDSLDGKDLCAAETCDALGRRILFGWIPLNASQPGNQYWGGHVALPREVFGLPDGQLGVKLETHVDTAIRGQERVAITPATLLGRQGAWQLTSAGVCCLSASGYQVATFAGLHERVDIQVDLTLGATTARAGLLLDWSPDQSGFEIAIDKENQRLLIGERFSTVHAQLPLDIQSAQLHRLRAIVEHDIAEVFLDDKYSLVARLPRKLSTTCVGLMSEAGPACFEQIEFCQFNALSDIPTSRSAAEDWEKYF